MLGYIQVTLEAATQISEEDDELNLRLFHRGEISIKGKGTMDAYLVLRDEQAEPETEDTVV